MLAHFQIEDGGFDYRLLHGKIACDFCFTLQGHRRKRHHRCQPLRSEIGGASRWLLLAGLGRSSACLPSSCRAMSTLTFDFVVLFKNYFRRLINCFCYKAEKIITFKLLILNSG